MMTATQEAHPVTLPLYFPIRSLGVATRPPPPMTAAYRKPCIWRWWYHSSDTPETGLTWAAKLAAYKV